MTDDEGRLVEVVEGCFGPAADVDGAFLSEVEVREGLRRLVGAAAETPLAAAELGRVLAAALGLAVCKKQRTGRSNKG